MTNGGDGDGSAWGGLRTIPKRVLLRVKLLALTLMSRPCEIKSRLYREWTDALERYADIVVALPDKRVTMPKDEYTELLRTLDSLRTRNEKLQRDLKLHKEVHGC
jgi:hypothetical protein